MSEAQVDQQRIIARITEATNSLTDEEAAQRYQQILSQLPPDQAEELNALALSQVSSGERRSLAHQFKQAHNDPGSPFAGYTFGDDDDDDTVAAPTNLGRMTARAQQQDPALLGGLLGNSGLGGTIGKAALAALAALLVRRFLSGQGGGYGGQQMPAGGGLGSILGGLLGGGASGGLGGYGGQQAPMGADPMGSILGGLLGGGASGGLGGYGGQQMPTGGVDLGSILGGLLGGGAGTQHLPRGGGGDLGSILGSILGGGGAAPGAGSHRKG